MALSAEHCNYIEVKIACVGWWPVFNIFFLLGFFLFVTNFAERLDQDMSGILTTICNHSFHCSCISMWTDSSCPVSYSLVVANSQVRACAFVLDIHPRAMSRIERAEGQFHPNLLLKFRAYLHGSC